nr:hypothetical protein [Tanacetum cinerariifolium]
EIPCFGELEPQPKPLPNCSSLNIILGEERGPEPPIKPNSPDSFRMKAILSSILKEWLWLRPLFLSADSPEESFGYTIKISVDVTHFVPVTLAVFPASTVMMRLDQHEEAIRGIREHLLEVPIHEELRALRDRLDVAEAEKATLRATIMTMGAVEMVLRNLPEKIGIHYKSEPQYHELSVIVMAAPTILIFVDSFEGNFRDTIGIDVDEELTALRNRVDIVEAANASLHATIRTMEAIKTVTYNHERLARIKIKHQLALVQESHHQDREDFKNLKEFMTSQFG